MRERKNTVVLFSKLPEPGKVKTRLTTLKDGVFTPEQASVLYHCMLFDVAEIICVALNQLQLESDVLYSYWQEADGHDHDDDCGCGDDHGAAHGHTHLKHDDPIFWDNLSAEFDDMEFVEGFDDYEGPDFLQEDEFIHDTYEFIISTAPASNVDAMRALFMDSGEWPHEIIFTADRGANFDEHYNDAFQQAWDRGADCVLSFGADMPALTAMDIFRGFEALHDAETQPEGGIVIAPDQEMGVSMVGWTRQVDEEGFDHTGVYYCQNGLTVLPAYIQKAREAQLPVHYLPPIPDVDTMRDLMHAVTVVDALSYTAPFDGNTPPYRTAKALKELGWEKIVVPPNDLMDPRDHIDVADDK